ncbi:MAG: winged helix-turn-helix domain-containing protein [Pseudomonadota bacterium]
MTLVLSGWRIDPGSRQASKSGTTRILSPRAVKLIEALKAADGAVLSRSYLLDKIWPDVFVSDESLTQVVAEVRRVLGDKGVIATVPKGGYRLAKAAASEAPAPQALWGCGIADLEAHAFCLEARLELARCGPGSIQRAVQLTEEAVSLAPDCAVALTENALALVRAHLYWSEGRDMIDAAIQSAERAVSRAPWLATGHSVLGYALSGAGQRKAADAAHSCAIAKEGLTYSTYHLAGWHLMSCGRTRSAITFFEQAGKLEVDNIKSSLHAALLCAGSDPVRSRRNARTALRRCGTRLETDPNDLRAKTAMPLSMLLLGQPDAAWDLMEDTDVRDSAQAIYAASALTLIGETDRAVSMLEELFDHGWRDMPWLQADPSFARISGHKRFEKMRRCFASA